MSRAAAQVPPEMSAISPGDGGDDSIVALEDEVVQLGGGDRPQRAELGRGIRIAEDIEGPVADGPAAKVWVVEAEPVESLQLDGLNTFLLLPWPSQRPC